jgi:hypothetical protein
MKCSQVDLSYWQYAEGGFQHADYPGRLRAMDFANESGYVTLWSLQDQTFQKETHPFKGKFLVAF